ncbi:MAG TPA: hypothetical protein VM118_15225 [Acidobacteriota bacterium]|nr:hypothetical protein [Acidobacteriota bacterium]
MQRLPRIDAWGLMIIVIAGLLLACTSERSIESNGEERSFVYVSIQQDTVVTIIFDADADTIIDSIRIPEWIGAPYVYADPRRPVVALTTAELRMFRGAEPLPQSIDYYRFAGLGFIEDPDWIVASVSGCLPGGGRTAAYNATDLSQVYSDTLGLLNAQVCEEQGLLFGISSPCDPAEGPIFSLFASYDYGNRRVVETWSIDPDSSGRPPSLWRFRVHPDGRRLYVTTSTRQSHVLVCYDLRERVIIWRQPIVATLGEPRVTPDGKEVWYPDPGWGTPDPYDLVETVTVFDADNGTVLSEISLKDYRVGGEVPVTPRVVRFLPSGKKAYVLGAFNNPGPLLIIDVPSREVIKSFWQEDWRWLFDMDLGPAVD